MKSWTRRHVVVYFDLGDLDVIKQLDGFTPVWHYAKDIQADEWGSIYSKDVQIHFRELDEAEKGKRA